MELLELTANVRKTTGKGTGRSLRREGRIPGILYGPKTEPIMLSLNTRELEKVIKDNGSVYTPMNLTIINGDSIKKSAMIKELQLHPVTGTYVHVDFYEISLDKKIQVQVAVEITGKAPGVEEGGALQIIRRELDVMCLPLDIPDSIVVDVSGLGIGDSIHLGELPVSEGVELLGDGGLTVIAVSSPMATAVSEREEGEEEAEGEEGAASEEEGGESE